MQQEIHNIHQISHIRDILFPSTYMYKAQSSISEAQNTHCKSSKLTIHALLRTLQPYILNKFSEEQDNNRIRKLLHANPSVNH